jgi:hypothetical protein
MEHTGGENSSMECLREMQLPERESLGDFRKWIYLKERSVIPAVF